MITAEIPTTLDQSKFTVGLHKASLMHSSAFHAVAPWKYTTLLKLHDLEHLPGPHLGAKMLTVSSGAAMFARTILDEIKGDNLPTPTVCPASGGSVAVIWSVGEKQVEAIFGADRIGSFVLSSGDDVVENGEVSPNDAASLASALNDILAA